jgi:DtxR family transcriptional regulator, Mn-dependent transcriptional regulator
MTNLIYKYDLLIFGPEEFRMSQTLSEENYLKAIYHLVKQLESKVTVTSIADELANNPASVIDMLKKLTEKKLIQYDKIKGAVLTASGHKIAVQIVRKHRLWEVFLHDKLGYSWDEVHDIAEQLEHIRDYDLPDRLDKFLGFPQFDPHGDPIPQSNGHLPSVSSRPLSEVKANSKIKVISVSDSSADFLRYLEKQGIGIHRTITVKEIHAFDQSVLVELKDKKEVYLSAEAAKKVFVEMK